MVLKSYKIKNQRSKEKMLLVLGGLRNSRSLSRTINREKAATQGGGMIPHFLGVKCTSHP